jgi:hypothetical protein
MYIHTHIFVITGSWSTNLLSWMATTCVRWVNAYMYTYLYICKYQCIYIYAFVFLYVYSNTCVFLYVYSNTCVFLYLHVCIVAYTYMCIYVYTYIYTCIQNDTYMSFIRPSRPNKGVPSKPTLIGDFIMMMMFI